MGRLFLLFLAALTYSVTATADVIVLDDDAERQVVHPYIEILEDETATLSLADVTRGSAADRFRDAGERYFSLGFTRSVYWYRFTVSNPDRQPTIRVLALDVPWIDRAELYIPAEDGRYERISMGDEHPFANREIRHNQYLNTLLIPPGQTTYLMRIRSDDPFMTPLTLRMPSFFDENEWQLGIYYGIFYGSLLVMLLYNGIIFLSIRDARYFFYCLYLATFFLMNFTYNGFAFQYLWPAATHWVNWSYGLFIVLFQLTGMLFAFSFLNPRKRMPHLYRVMLGFIVLLTGSLLFAFLAGDRMLYNMLSIYGVFIYSPLVALAGIVALLKGFRAARFFVIASLATLVGAFFSALTVSGFLPYTFLNYHAAEIGLLADMILLSLAMADRINLMRIEREDAHQRAIEKELLARETLSRAKDNLEITVEQRTRDLQAAKEEAEKLARIDVLTGVANRRSFEELANIEHARALRHERELSVIVFDLDMFKNINDTYGHHAGDEVISHAARLAMDAVRDIDTVGRTGGEEFAILLPETSETQAAEIAERLREQMTRSLISDTGREITYTASFGVSRMLPADTSTEPAIRRADTAMYAAKKLGRNRVVVWSESVNGLEN